MTKMCTISTGFAVRIISGEPEFHDHALDPEEVEAFKQGANLKRITVEHPELLLQKF